MHNLIIDPKVNDEQVENLLLTQSKRICFTFYSQILRHLLVILQGTSVYFGLNLKNGFNESGYHLKLTFYTLNGLNYMVT